MTNKEILEHLKALQEADVFCEKDIIKLVSDLEYKFSNNRLYKSLISDLTMGDEDKIASLTHFQIMELMDSDDNVKKIREIFINANDKNKIKIGSNMYILFKLFPEYNLPPNYEKFVNPSNSNAIYKLSEKINVSEINSVLKFLEDEFTVYLDKLVLSSIIRANNDIDSEITVKQLQFIEALIKLKLSRYDKNKIRVSTLKKLIDTLNNPNLYSDGFNYSYNKLVIADEKRINEFKGKIKNYIKTLLPAKVIMELML